MYINGFTTQATALRRLSSNQPLRAAGVVLYFSGGAVDDNRGAPIPGQQRGEVGDLVIGNPGEHVGEPGLGIHIVELGCVDQREHDCSALAAAIGTCEQPGLAAESNSAQHTFGSVVAQADASVF